MPFMETMAISRQQDVHDHVPACFSDVDTCAEHCGNGCVDQVRLAAAGTHDRITDRTFFQLRDEGRHADDDTGLDELVAADLDEEFADHTLRQQIIRDHALRKRMHHINIGRCFANHAVCLVTDRQNAFGACIVGNDGRFSQNHALFAQCHNDIGSTEINADIRCICHVVSS